MYRSRYARLLRSRTSSQLESGLDVCHCRVCCFTCLHKCLQVIEKELAWQRIHHITEEQALIPEGETLVWMCAAAMGADVC